MPRRTREQLRIQALEAQVATLEENLHEANHEAQRFALRNNEWYKKLNESNEKNNTLRIANIDLVDELEAAKKKWEEFEDKFHAERVRANKLESAVFNLGCLLGSKNPLY